MKRNRPPLRTKQPPSLDDLRYIVNEKTKPIPVNNEELKEQTTARMGLYALECLDNVLEYAVEDYDLLPELREHIFETVKIQIVNEANFRKYTSRWGED